MLHRQTGKIAIIANDQSSSDYSVFLFSGGSVIHTYLIDQSYVMEWIGNYSSDSDIIASIESDGSETGMLDMAGISNSLRRHTSSRTMLC